MGFTATVNGPTTPTAENLARTHLGDFCAAHPGFSASIVQSTGSKFTIPAQGVVQSYADLLAQVAQLQAEVTSLQTSKGTTTTAPAIT